MNKDLMYQAINEFEEISRIVFDRKDEDLGVLCGLLGGHNLDEDYGFFDLNYKSLCVTIANFPGHNLVVDDVEVWDEDGDHSYLAYSGSESYLEFLATKEGVI